MNIVLFHPRGFDAARAGKRVFNLATVLPPLGLASIAAALRKAGHTVTLLDANLHATVPNDQWAQRIAGLAPAVVGFTATTSGFLDAYDVCRLVKGLSSNITTVFGGVHASWGGARLLEQFEAIDFIIAGEGEQAFVELVEGTSHSRIEGLHYRNGTACASGPPRTTLCAMDDLPFPAYDLLKGFPGKYVLPLFSYPRHPATSIISSRGCIYRCSYCDRSVFRKGFRWNSPEYTMELVRWLSADYGIRHVAFYDDLFTLNRARVARLCGLLRNARLGMTFNCIVRIGHIDLDLIRELKSAGCWMVNVGIESGDQAMLDSHKEGLRLEDIRRDIELLHAENLWVKGLFMMGFPGETEESVKKTMTFACSLPLKDANVTAFTPFPGAPVCKGIASKGDFEDDWSKMDCVNFVFVPREIGSRAALEKYYGEFLRTFYHRPFCRKAYRRMLFESPHSYWRLLKHAGAFLGYARRIGSDQG
ncbi:MAG: radical SAM protein [Chitinivibrionales bacterium]|nr:radical SAM protein [Chitinivibrionales bacterium]MBD3396573.1 radical SAM protein [Chitinivibrionales bacterium]